MYTIQRIRAFINGVREMRLTATAHYDDIGLAEAYEWGRALAHRATAHHFDPAMVKLVLKALGAK